jgi:DNA mismatch repair protein MutS
MTTLTEEYFILTDKYKDIYGENTVLLMQVGAFFEIYGKKHNSKSNIFGSDIEEISKLCDLKISIKSKAMVMDKDINEKCELAMIGFRDYSIDKYLDKLIENSYICVVYKQKEDKKTERYEAGIFSPGTYFKEDETLTNSNFIMCISIFHKKPNKFITKDLFYYGISCINIINGETFVREYNEKYYKSLTTFDELEKIISIYNPNETIIAYESENITEQTIDIIIKYVKINSKIIRKIDTSKIINNDMLNKQCEKCKSEIIQYNIMENYYGGKHEQICDNLKANEYGFHSFCFLLYYMNLHNKDLVKNIKEPKIYNDEIDENLLLANHSLKQLNIISDGNYNKNNNLSSVVKFLNKCSTAMGKRKMNLLLTNPIINSKKLINLYDITEYIIDNYDIFENIDVKYIKYINDIEKIYRSFMLKLYNLNDIYKLYDNLNIVNDIIYEISLNKIHINGLKINNYHEIQESNNYILNYFNTTFDFDKSYNSDINIFIRNKYHEIDSLYDSYNNNIIILRKINTIISNLIKSTERKSKEHIEYSRLHETDKSGYLIKCTNTRSKKLKNVIQNEIQNKNNEIVISNNNNKYYLKLKDIEIKKSGQNDSKITSPLINKLINSIFNEKIKLEKLVQTKIHEFITKFQEDKLTNYYNIIVDFITHLDINITKAKISKKYNYCKPQINNKNSKSYLNAKNMRHVLIEHINTNEIYVPNDVCLNCDNETMSSFLLFGTNAVGKSSLIKSIGITIIMAQSGFYVPCSEFIFKPYKSLFTRILGNDNIFKGLSTFAVEMSELRTILRLSNENSLVLGDELCSGTELGSAISIFISGLIFLAKKQSTFIFATHFHEVTEMDEIKNIENLEFKHMSVYYDHETDILVYDRKLKDGPGNNRYGLEVCKSLNLPQDFIDMAYKIRNTNEDMLGKVKKSRYNSKKISGGLCEMCGDKSDEVHHLQHQKYADSNGMINKQFHKNHTANLINVCEKCHNKFHETSEQYKRVKSTNGYKIVKIRKIKRKQ